MSSSSPVGKSLTHWSSSEDVDIHDTAGTALIEAQFYKWNIMISLLH